MLVESLKSTSEAKESTVRKKMVTGTFTYNALRTKTLKERIKTQRKIVSHSNSTRAMLLVQERLPLNRTFSICPVGLVWFTRYCGKMYSRHFPYGGYSSKYEGNIGRKLLEGFLC